MREKRIVLVNDVTGLSRCSVACQLPIISAMGIESQIPFEPIIFGRINNGIAINTIDLPIETITDSKGFSIEVRKDVEIIFAKEIK